MALSVETLSTAASGRDDRPVLLVLADSLSYYGPRGGLAADDPRIWPNLVAERLGWRVELVARVGWTTRDAWWALTQDPRVWAAVPHAGAVVFGVSGMDSLPSPLPTALREQIRYLRPEPVRRAVRAGYQVLQPRLARLGRPLALPPQLTSHYLEKCRGALQHLRPGLPVVATLPSRHICDAYGRVHAGRDGTVRAIEGWAGQHGVPLVDLGAATGEHVLAGRGNPDGIHWGFEGHSAVAEAMLGTLGRIVPVADAPMSEGIR
ncbi:diglucosylglycerate octanoyltransferase [Tomitella fengzijianii]|uniref:SGNH/GDSL hydrolase family protein n=1 Tax=Tomitella fengzijianii TaxID=2597660 RepID=A0A516X4U8_9ACTN|nr:diglucosylglycerate octanoyltransferase [Tomitella fengzijianii]QDQ98033.1 SGNH/GDSL hydrolase family protein [Tomitella fengzijianii]